MLNIGSFKPLSELCSIISSGGTPSRKIPHYFDKNGHLWVKSKELLFKGIDDTEEKISDEGLKKSSAKYYPSGTILVAMYGANVGQLAWLKKPATVNQAICALVVNEQKADNMFVYYSLLHTREKLIVQAQGAAQQNLNAGQIKSFEIPYIDLENQQKIASILSTYDDLIENNNRRIAILEEMARNLYREWFVKFRFPGHEEVKMIDSELGQIPEGWEIVKYTDIIDVMSGGTPKTDNEQFWNGGIPFFTPKDAGTNSFCIETIKELSEQGLKKCNSRLYPQNTVFITARGTVGKVVLAGRNMAMNQSCYALQRKIGIGQIFVYQLTLERVNHLKKNASGATFDAIVVDTFERMKVIKPPLSLTDHFETKAQSIFALILNLSKRNQNLKTQRDMLLPKLISGKIEIAE